MRKLFNFLFLFLSAAVVHGQKLSQISFLNGSNLSFFSILTNQDVLVRISENGKILEWGTEEMSYRGNYYAQKLQPYMGRVEYYGPESDSAFAGKVKSIGVCGITYYGSYDEAAKRGKIKTMGILYFDYYSNYDNKSLQGRLKMLGDLPITYYDQYENEAFRGKLKSFGSLPVAYYSAFDDKYNAGKLKSIGSVTYTWYSQYERARGALKSNNYRYTISGITVVLR